ncbi:ribosomal RNA small subunit methyltransferase D [bacterium BMS3Abin10]|nr:ribosomal RNA small subunit methyltransferase D [bacterium BMS3Abin10]GBE39352.1 ribosomal RNA small subunit methyltransferase D [bacterium BMS3Bbin08]HDK16593.1 16S rRNA (guanine(966)-N(2))-methyltransferase RsmD [Nitrospirota bacterium]
MAQKRSLRPTTGKVREAVLNILRDSIEGALFLDLYAGTGAVGVEALRQGAAEAIFVEADSHNLKAIDKLIKKSGLSERARVITGKVLKFIEWAELNSLTFDIIFLDPPYHTDEIIHALTAIGGSHIMRPGGRVMAEHFAKKHLPDRFGSLQKIKDYHYGDSILSLYKTL